MHLPRHVAWYLIFFMVGSALGLVPILIVEVFENTNDSVAATIVATVREMQAVVVVCGGLSFGTVESVTMLAEIFLRNREEKGRKEGRLEERRQMATRLAGMTAEERMAEINRFIEETLNDKGQ